VTDTPTTTAAAEPFTEHSVRMLVSPELLCDVLRLPEGSYIHGVELKQADSGFGHTMHFQVHVLAPAGAVVMEPTYYTSTGWPDPIHLHDITWIDRDGKRIGGEVKPLPMNYRTSRTHPRYVPADPDETLGELDV
jgi:hypothetical protein